MIEKRGCGSSYWGVLFWIPEGLILIYGIRRFWSVRAHVECCGLMVRADWCAKLQCKSDTDVDMDRDRTCELEGELDGMISAFRFDSK